MTRRLFSIAAFCCTFFVGANAQITLNTQLAAYFPFDTCAGTDYSGNGGVGVLDSTIRCVCGVSGNGIEFDVANEDARFVGNVASVFNTGNFTVSFYMKPQSTPTPGATQLVMSKQDTCSTKNAFWVRYRRQGQNSQSSNVISTSISQNDSLNVTLNAKLDDDRCWYHIVIVREGVKYQLYVDGILRDQKSSPVRIDISNNSTLTLSKPKCPLDGGYFGLIDELRFYNRAYSADEIRRLLAINPDKIVNQDTVVYLGNSFTPKLTGTCAQSFIWSPLEGLSDYQVSTPEMMPIEKTTYVLRFNHLDGCAAYDTIVINVIDPDTLDCSKLFIPNAFSPGFSDGRNDVFFISNAFAISDFISFEVFDRWGGRLFEALSVTDFWDGTFAGKPVNAGIYLYRVRYKCQGEEKVYSGTVTLLR
jgi:gliding motility-associated-like protein